MLAALNTEVDRGTPNDDLKRVLRINEKYSVRDKTSRVTERLFEYLRKRNDLKVSYHRKLVETLMLQSIYPRTSRKEVKHRLVFDRLRRYRGQSGRGDAHFGKEVGEFKRAERLLNVKTGESVDKKS